MKRHEYALLTDRGVVITLARRHLEALEFLHVINGFSLFPSFILSLSLSLFLFLLCVGLYVREVVVILKGGEIQDCASLCVSGS